LENRELLFPLLFAGEIISREDSFTLLASLARRGGKRKGTG